jgi:RNA polymerase sigma-70 factor (ECF subfamily)
VRHQPDQKVTLVDTNRASTTSASESFEEHRAHLFGIAYRMLGQVAEAEDQVQETFIRWQRSERPDVQSLRAYLTTIITRLCIDHLRSAQHQREQYVGMWLPEPLVALDDRDPASAAQLADSVTNAFLLLMEALSPVERAVFLLREVFGYEYDEVSRIVGKSEANCRQMLARSRTHLVARRPRFQVSPDHAEKLVEQFQRMCSSGDTDGLISMLSEDAAIYADGGGKASAVRKPVLGATAVARFLIAVYQKAGPQVRVQPVIINAEPGALVFIADKLEQAITFELEDNRIRAIYVVRNPDKLEHLVGQS